jgi:hypothetical protein
VIICIIGEIMSAYKNFMKKSWKGRNCGTGRRWGNIRYIVGTEMWKGIKCRMIRRTGDFSEHGDEPGTLGGGNVLRRRGILNLEQSKFKRSNNFM